MRKEGLTVITGSSSGIGRSLVESFSAHGFRVAATARRKNALEDLSHGCALTAQLDISLPRSVERFAELLRKKKEKVSILVNNAGYGLMGPLAEIERTALSRQFETNVTGAVDMVRALLPFMSGESLIINIGSVSGDVASPWAGAYCASKAALHVLSDVMRMELSPFGIQVLTVKPGGIRSAFGARASESAWFPADSSRYARFRDGIRARANESQSRSAPAEELAERIVREAGKPRTARELRFGPKSRSIVVLKHLLPSTLYDRIKMKRYGLK